MKHSLASLFTVLFFMLLLAGCIREDFSDCPPDATRLSFAYTNSCNPELAYPADIDSLHLFVFDTNGVFTAEYRHSGIRLNKDFYVELPLDAGEHILVTWAGTGNAYQTGPVGFTAGTTTFHEAMLWLRKETTNGIPDSVLVCRQSLYFGLDTLEGGANHLVNLTKNTTRINLSVSGLNIQDSYRIAINGDDNHYKFDNSFTSTEKVNYIQPLLPDNEGNAQAVTDILNPSKGNHPFMSIKNTAGGKEIFHEDLIKLITDRMPDVNFDCIHEFDIKITFKTDLSVSVSVNGWNLNEEDEDLR